MRAFLGIAWLFVGLAAVIFHYGPGVEFRELDRAGRFARQAHRAAAEHDWDAAIRDYDEALAALPESRQDDAWQLRLEKAKSQMMAAQLPEAREALDVLLQEISQQRAASSPIVQDTRSALASSQYYMTWLMRLEGAPKDVWEPEIEAARQQYRAISESAASAHDDTRQETALKDLEAAIRLARLDLSELQALPLPSQ